MRRLSLALALLVSTATVHAGHFSTFGGGAQPVSRRAKGQRGGDIRKVTMTSSVRKKERVLYKGSKLKFFDRDRTINLDTVDEQWVRSGDDSVFFYPEEAEPLKFLSYDDFKKVEKAREMMELDKKLDEEYDEYEDEEAADSLSDNILKYVKMVDLDAPEEIPESAGLDILLWEKYRNKFQELYTIPYGPRKLRLIPWRLAKGTVETGFGFFWFGFALGGIRGLPWLLFRKVLGVDAPFIPETIGRLKRWSGKGARWGLAWAKIGAPMAVPTLAVKWARGVPYFDEYSMAAGYATFGFMAGRKNRWQPYAPIVAALLLGYVGFSQGPAQVDSYKRKVLFLEAYKAQVAEKEKQRALEPEEEDDDDDDDDEDYY